MAYSPSLLLPQGPRWGENEPGLPLSVTHMGFNMAGVRRAHMSLGITQLKAGASRNGALLGGGLRRVSQKQICLSSSLLAGGGTDQISCWTINSETHIDASVWSFGGVTGAIVYDSVSRVQPFKNAGSLSSQAGPNKYRSSCCRVRLKTTE